MLTSIFGRNAISLANKKTTTQNKKLQSKHTFNK